MLDAFTPKRISPNCPFKSYQRLSQILILTPRCAVWLRGVMHTTQLDSEVWCTPRSLTTWCAAHRGAWLCSRKHTSELDSAVGCTSRSFLRKLVPLTSRYDAHRGAQLRGGMHTAESDWFKKFCFSCFRTCCVFRLCFIKNVLSKKDSLNNLWLI